MKILAFIKNYSGALVVVLICLMLWMLNVRNTSLEATNKRLERLTDSKDDQIHQLRETNSDMAVSLSDLAKAAQEQNDVVEKAIGQRAEADQQIRNLQDEIKRYLAGDKCAAAAVPADAAERLRNAAKAAGRVPNDKSPGAAVSGQPAH